MDVEVEPLNAKDGTINDVFYDFACRVCLFRDKENSEISSTFAGYISKHLCFQIDKENYSRFWICQYCQQSLESFHNFYSKVSQIQESVTNLVSVLQKTPHGLDNTPNFDDEFDAIDLTVGFGRGKSPSKKQIVNQPRRIGTRSTTKIGKRKTVGKELLLSPIKIKKETEPVEVFEDAASEVVTTDHNYTNDYNSVSNPQDVILQDNTGNSGCRAESEKSVPSKDDDLSSLEDQDWVGQGFNFDSDDSGADDAWKPPGKSKKKKTDQQGESCDQIIKSEDEEDLSDDDPDAIFTKTKKPKFTISATHGIGPKPKITPCVKKMLRDDINAKFVEFYGIYCDICTSNQNNSLTVEHIKYDSFAALCNHMKSEHNVRGYVKCCNCTMREKKRAERHMLLHTQPGSIFKCNICSKQLSTHQSFRTHLILHLPDNERPFQCNACDRGFASKPDLTLHERSHLPEDKRLMFTCDICGSRFAHDSGLLLHKQRVHENNRPHLCDICAKSFKSRCDMERHKAQTHEDVKREQCPECGKWFKGKSILKTHMRQHMGASFQCQYCDKTYTVRSSWKAHLITHSTEKPHKCPVCDKAFKLPGTLKMHLNQHTGEHPWACPYCPKTFASSGNFYTHRKRMHPNEVAALKKNTEDSLVANGLPPPPTGPIVPTQSMSEAIERTKEKVAAKAKQNPSVVSLNADTLVNNTGDCDVSPSANILTEKCVLSNTLIMSSAVVAPEGNGVNLLLPNGLRVVRIISADGVSKYGLGKKGQETMNLAQQSLLPIEAQSTQIELENDIPGGSLMPPSVD